MINREVIEFVEKLKEEALFDYGLMDRSNPCLSVAEITRECESQGWVLSIEEMIWIVEEFGRGSEGFIPKPVARFVACILKPHSPKIILEPWVGKGGGFLFGELKRSLAPKVFHAYVPDAKYFQCTKSLEVSGQDFLKIQPMKGPFGVDAIVCSPKFHGTKEAFDINEVEHFEINGRQETYHMSSGNRLMFQACRRLAPSGIAVFIASSSFFTQPKVRELFATIGCEPTSAIELPHGTFAPFHNQIRHVVVLEKKSSESIFTGRLSENNEEALLNNLAERTASKNNVEQGCIEDVDSFRGFTAISLRESVRRKAKKYRLKGHQFSKIIDEIKFVKNGRSENTNAVYLPQKADENAVISTSDLERQGSGFQIIIKRQFAEPEFFAGFLNSPLGIEWRESLCSFNNKRKISKDAIMDSTVFLPSPTEQGKIINCQRHLNMLALEIRDQQKQLWKSPSKVGSIIDCVKSINERYPRENWIASLPFPLGTVLRQCDDDSGTHKTKIYFFESLAEFVCTVLLSAFSAEEGSWAQHRNKIKEIFEGQSFVIERSSFGLWTSVWEYLAKQLRSTLKKSPDQVYDLFKTRDRDVLKALSSIELIDATKKVNNIRNQDAHSGPLAPQRKKEINADLERHIRKVREVFGFAFEGYELILAGQGENRDSCSTYTVERIIGTESSFKTKEIEVNHIMHAGHLYLKSPSEQQALKLLPLIKVLSMQNEVKAFFFYNKITNTGVKFCSYHYAPESEKIGEFVEVRKAIDRLGLSEGKTDSI